MTAAHEPTHESSLWIQPWHWGPIKRFRRQFRTWRNERFWQTPAAPVARSTNARIIVTLTTSPKRLPHLQPTLASLLNQSIVPDEIHLNVPLIFQRTGEPYVLPAWLTDFDSRVMVYRLNDIGPATKSVPTVARIAAESNAIIIVADDDVRYLHRTIEVLVSAIARDPSNAYGLSGYSFASDWSNQYERRETLVEVLEGWASWAAHRSTLGDGISAYFESVRSERPCFLHDDVVMSNWLAMRNIPRIRLFDPRANTKLMKRRGAQLASGYEHDALHKGAGGLVQSLDPRAVAAALARRGALALRTPDWNHA